MENNIILNVRDALKLQSDEKTKDSSLRFFKEEVNVYGVKTALVSKIAKDYFEKIKDRGKKEVFSLCEELLRSGYCEEAWIAANWAYWVHEQYEPGDFAVFEQWVEKYIDNWAECDTLCNHAVGAFIEQYPEYIGRLKQWTKAEGKH